MLWRGFAPPDQQAAQFEVDLAGELAAVGSPVVAPAPGAASRVFDRDDFVMTFWTYYAALPNSAISSADYANGC